MSNATRNALIGSGIGALAGGIGGHLVDRGAKREGNWWKRNKGAVIGALGGGAIGSAIGHSLGRTSPKNTGVEISEQVSENPVGSVKSKLSDAEIAYNKEEKRLDSIYKKLYREYDDKFDGLFHEHYKSNRDMRAAIKHAEQNTVKENELVDKALNDLFKFQGLIK